MKNLLLEKDERLVYSCLSLRPKNVGELLKKTGISVPEMMDILARLLQKGFIQEALSQGAGEIVDFFAIHPYTRQCFITTSGHERVSESIIEKIEEARKVYSHIPLLVTEIGVSPLLNLRVGPREVALIYQKLLIYYHL